MLYSARQIIRLLTLMNNRKLAHSRDLADRIEDRGRSASAMVDARTVHHIATMMTRLGRDGGHFVPLHTSSAYETTQQKWMAWK